MFDTSDLPLAFLAVLAFFVVLYAAAILAALVAPVAAGLPGV